MVDGKVTTEKDVDKLIQAAEIKKLARETKAEKAAYHRAISWLVWGAVAFIGYIITTPNSMQLPEFVVGTLRSLGKLFIFAAVIEVVISNIRAIVRHRHGL